MTNYRIPRPIGTTILCLEYQKLNTDTAKESVLKHLIVQYTLQGFRFNGQPKTIPEMSQILRIPVTDIMAQISHTSQNLGSFSDPEQIENTLKTIVTLSTTWAIQDRGQIAKQLDTMISSQGETYKPFISGEVNRALKLLLESNKNIIDMYKTFFTQTNNTTNILNVYKNKDQEEFTDFVSTDKALELITKTNKAIQGNQGLSLRPSGITDNELDQLADKYGIVDSSDILESDPEAISLSPTAILDSSNTKALKPISLKAKRLKNKINPHENPDSRRGETYIDMDEIPDTE